MRCAIGNRPMPRTSPARVTAARGFDAVPLILPAHHPDKNARPARHGGERLACEARGLEERPGRLEEDSLLRIESFGLERRDIEEERVELVGVAQKSTPLRRALTL